MDQQNDQNNQPEQQPTSPAPTPVVTEAPPSEQLYQSAPSEEPISAIKAVEKVTVWVMVFSAIFFALISILAVWGMFSDSGEIVGRSLSTIAIIAVTALIINVGATMLESKKK